jgi:TolB-like protein
VGSAFLHRTACLAWVATRRAVRNAAATVELRRVHRYLLAVFACLSVFLVAATPAFTIVPTVIVYPLAASSAELDRETSSRIATTLATQIAQGGLVKVIAPKSGVERVNYLADARAAGANYYVTGFVTPLGQGASVVEQVVSTISGTLVFSETNYITSMAEIASQGDQLRQGIVDRSTRGIQAFQAPPPPAVTPEPEPSNGTETPLSKIFGHKKAAAEPVNVAAAPPQNATVAVLTVGGSADSDHRAAAAQSLAAAFERDGLHAVVVTADSPSSALCTANKATSLVGAWLDMPAGSPNATLRLVGYDCTGKIAYDRSFQQPLAAVSDAAVNAYVNPPKRRG